VETAADGLTSALNAYGAGADKAESYSDALFTAMRAGKTTVGQLASSLGKVAPTAAQVGVSFDELLAATAAITTTGLGTSETMNSLRQVMAAVVKPTKQAESAAHKLGIQFNVAAMKSKGLVGFLSDVQKATGGSSEKLAELFGSVEALGSVMFLTSKDGGAKFLEIIEDMEKKSGQTEAAFDKMSKTAGFMSDVLKQKVRVQMLSVGTTIMQSLTPALGFVVTNFDKIIATGKDLATLLGAGALGVALANLPTILTKIRSGVLAATAATKAWTVALLANPIGLLVGVLATVGTALYLFRDKQVEIGGKTVEVGNIIKAAWDLVGTKFSDFFKWFADVGQAFVDFFKDDITGALGSTEGEFSGFFSQIVTWAKEWVNTVIGYWDAVGTGLGIVIGKMVTNWENLWTGILELAKSGWKGIQAIFNGDLSFQALRDQLDKELMPAGEDISVAFNNAWEDIQGTDYIDAAVTSFETVKTEIVDSAVKMGEAESAAERMGTEIESSAGTAATGVDNMGDSANDAAGDMEDMAGKSVAAVEGIGIKTESVATVVNRGFERMRDGVGDFFKDLIVNGKASFDGLLDMFKNLIAEMIATAASNRIMIGLGLAGGSASASASGGGSSGGFGWCYIANSRWCQSVF